MFPFAAYNRALEDAVAVLEKIAMNIDVKDRKFLFSPFFGVFHILKIIV